MPTKQYVNTCSISPYTYILPMFLLAFSLHVPLLLYIHTCHCFLLPPPQPRLPVFHNHSYDITHRWMPVLPFLYGFFADASSVRFVYTSTIRTYCRWRFCSIQYAKRKGTMQVLSFLYRRSIFWRLKGNSLASLVAGGNLIEEWNWHGS